jgi:hypothetical protein
LLTPCFLELACLAATSGAPPAPSLSSKTNRYKVGRALYQSKFPPYTLGPTYLPRSVPGPMHVLTPRYYSNTLTLDPNTLLELLERQEDIYNNNPRLIVTLSSLVKYALAQALVRERRVIGSNTKSSSSSSSLRSSPYAIDTSFLTSCLPPIFSSPPQSLFFYSARPSPSLPSPY